MARVLRAIGPVAGSGIHCSPIVLRHCLAIVLILPGCVSWARAGQPREEERRDSTERICRALVDERLREPLGAIAEEYTRRTGVRVTLDFRPALDIDALLEKRQTAQDLVLSMPAGSDGKTPVSTLPGATKVAWKYPSGEPVWAAALTDHSAASALVRFAGGQTGHRLWSESKAGFTITTGKTHAEAFDWVVEHRVKHTYPVTAVRMLGELGGIREGVLIDVGCGTGNLDVELAKRSAFTITGLDIDPNMQPLFERRVREAGFQDRIRFVTGDAQQMPFPDDHADVIVSRGTLTFIPDIGKCLQEVDRVLKPTGVAFLGGRYPNQDRDMLELFSGRFLTTGVIP